MTKKKNILLCLLLVIIIINVLLIIFSNKDNNIKNIKLENEVTGIYKWKCDIKDKKIVKLDDRKSGEKEKLAFKSLKKGKTEIKCTFFNTRNGSYDEIKKYIAIVDKDLNLELKEKVK